MTEATIHRAAWPIRAWFSFWIWVLYALRLRRPLNNLQRRLTGEHKAAHLPLAELNTPAELMAHLKPFGWRKDSTRIGGRLIGLDYVSDPGVFEARLKAQTSAHGDCDDVHHYAATQLLKMASVAEAYHVTIGYQGGGHVACVYRTEPGLDVPAAEWWLLNYQQITAITSPQDAATPLLKWATQNRHNKGLKGPAKMRWLVFETTDLQRVR